MVIMTNDFGTMDATQLTKKLWLETVILTNKILVKMILVNLTKFPLVQNIPEIHVTPSISIKAFAFYCTNVIIFPFAQCIKNL